MEIDKGCLQPSVFDDSIFGEYIGTLCEHAAGAWGLAVKTSVSQNCCRVFEKVHGGICHVTLMFGSMSKPP